MHGKSNHKCKPRWNCGDAIYSAEAVWRTRRTGNIVYKSGEEPCLEPKTVHTSKNPTLVSRTVQVERFNTKIDFLLFISSISAIQDKTTFCAEKYNKYINTGDYKTPFTISTILLTIIAADGTLGS